MTSDLSFDNYSLGASDLDMRSTISGQFGSTTWQENMKAKGKKHIAPALSDLSKRHYGKKKMLSPPMQTWGTPFVEVTEPAPFA